MASVGRVKTGSGTNEDDVYLLVQDGFLGAKELFYLHDALARDLSEPHEIANRVTGHG